MKKFFSFLGMAFLGGALTLGGYKMLFDEPIAQNNSQEVTLPTIQANYNSALNTIASATDAASIDFTIAAEKTVNSVVHVKNTSIRTQQSPLDIFFGTGNGTRKFEQVGTGSGVIISADGYIVTNNHVIDNASAIEITLNNKKKYEAELIGADATNDIALLKIDAEIDLPYTPFTNSDNVKIGEWVLAVGNPYNLTSTVTAGIVSAKGRDLEGNVNIESFIQTDAAVNPGNSGGALVNTRGELVGINTAISSRTGSFIGYSFAVPSNIAKKVVDDLLEFGAVQEAILGIGIDNRYEDEGVKIGKVYYDEGANNNQFKEGDIIKSINNVKISKFSELKGQLTAKRPGDYVDVTIEREGELITKKVVLNKKDTFNSRTLNISLKDVTAKEKKKFDIKGGAKIIQNNNRTLNYYGITEGYIITKVNSKPVTTAAEATRKIENSKVNRGTPLFLELINPKGEIEKIVLR
ncbi:trypsin-like peptidase domain-containing protein [Polaribacter dokdonensis]|uniref:Serine protease, S1-C subfamily, contains C-terminal PDZ domain n=1 Tax=Polaribacter dokdonensis DSW-5 TaxID=1300348 RepID=A0A0M9CES5_9FLAO|nr:trypsin-like peptidase domain-containing protein [Polaribacter dokdonensis]KOY50699.1 Trypsin-like serine protease [Polaribacter dokdonensis DSW-5]SEE28220.1 serine protease, S1-C subfamily, contains C-terminal PDZ domain [Polaribacter dokdonensis DSW-5]